MNRIGLRILLFACAFAIYAVLAEEETLLKVAGIFGFLGLLVALFAPKR